METGDAVEAEVMDTEAIVLKVEPEDDPYQEPLRSSCPSLTSWECG